LRQVLVADGIALLNGFGLSKGAVLEVLVASYLKLPVRPLAEWLTHGD